MPIDPLTTAITATVTWIVDKYGELFVDKMAEGVAGKREDQAQRQAWERATTTYLRKLHDEVNTLRVLGKQESQSLERIYTDVNVLDKLSAERRYSLDELKADFMPRHRWRHDDRRSGLEVAAKRQRLFILGKPGAGKTTFLKHVTLRTIKDNGRKNGPKKLPVFVTLKELSDSGQAIVPFMAEQFRRADFPEAQKFVLKLLKAGDAVVILDGLDEVNLEGQQRANLITAIKQFVHEFDQCRILLTCRVAATDYSFERFAYVEMADFNQEQQKTFIFRWFQQDMVKRDNCWQALQESRNETLQELAQIPLLLSLLCVTFEERNEFPAERNEIYREATQALLGKWDARRNIRRDPIYQALSLKHKERLLAQIAAQTFEDREYFIKEKQLVNLIEAYLQGVPGIAEPDGIYVLAAMEAQHGLLVERAKGIHSFSHLTLQEYFTAHYIVGHEATGAVKRLMTHVGNDRWREVFLLTAAMLNDASAFAELYLQSLVNLVAQNKTVTNLLHWNAARSTNLHSGVMPSAARAFGLFLARAYDLTRTNTLARARANDNAFAYAHTLARVLARTHARARALALTIDFTHDRVFALDVAVANDLNLVNQIPNNTAEIISTLQEWGEHFDLSVRDRLANLQTPNDEAAAVDWQLFNAELEQILLQYWGLEQFWELSKKQSSLLARYLKANLLLLECMDLAYVSDREAILDRLLLPPG